MQVAWVGLGELPRVGAGVGLFVDELAAGLTIPEVLADFPYLDRDDVLAALEYAAAAVQERELPLAHSA